MTPAWNALLRQERQRAGLSREAVADRSGVSRHTVVAYELGRRPPTRDTLLRIARSVSRTTVAANHILAAAGFHPEPAGVLERLYSRRPPPTSLADELGRYAWPCLAVNDRFEIVGWNASATQVAERDFATVYPAPRERNLMRIAADPHFRQRATNWHEIVSDLLGFVKDGLPDLFASEERDAYFAALVNDIATHHPEALPDLMRLWATATPYDARHRNIYYPSWRPADGSALRFNTVVTVWSDFDAVYANEWHPADAVTWEWLASRRHDTQAVAAHHPAPAREAEQGPMWFALLRSAREQSGLTRRQLADLAHVHVRTLDNWETGRHEPDREGILHLTRVLRLDGATTNGILAAADLDPEPSDWALFLARETPRAMRGRYEGTEPPPASHADIRREISAHAWPCLVVGTGCDIIGGNVPLARVLGVDLRRGRLELRYRNLVRFFLSREVRAHVTNWDEVVTAVLPSTLRQALTAARVAPALQPLLEGLAREEPEVVGHLRALWHAAPPPVLRGRVAFPLVWRHHDGAALAFNGIISLWDSRVPSWVFDWHPADAATWDWLAGRR